MKIYFIFLITFFLFILIPAFSDNNYFFPYKDEPFLSLDGTTYFDIPHNNTLSLQNFTIAAWIKNNQSSLTKPAFLVNKGGFGSEEEGKNMNYGFWFSSKGIIQAGFETKSGEYFAVNSTKKLDDGKWHYVLLSYDGSLLKLHVDGKNVSTKVTYGALPDNNGTQPLRIGANSQNASTLNTGKFFTGNIDEIRIWKSGLTDVELDELYNNTLKDKEQIRNLNFGENIKEITTQSFDLYTLLTVGGFGAAGIGAGLTYLSNIFIKRREERVNTSNLKLQEISKLFLVYGNMISYYNGLSQQLDNKLRKKDFEIKLTFFYWCHILRLRRKLFKEYGTFVLYDLNAESTINNFGEIIHNFIKEKFGSGFIDNMIEIVQDDITYIKFIDILESYPTNIYTKNIYSKNKKTLMIFEKLFTEKFTDEEIKSLRDKAKWFSELLLFEMNYTHEKWYNQKPDFYKLDQDLKNYLLSKHKDEDNYKNLVTDKMNDKDKEKGKLAQQYKSEIYIDYYNRLAKIRGKKFRIR